MRLSLATALYFSNMWAHLLGVGELIDRNSLSRVEKVRKGWKLSDYVLPWFDNIGAPFAFCLCQVRLIMLTLYSA